MSGINENRQATRPASKAQLASIATDGVYIVRGINYKGDARGQEWYMDMVCEARGADDLARKSVKEKALP
ncbi:hypothetical protein EV102420_43_00100 [Pseudescherichia vulneris NBRC 102420]|uniref:Uncharacterized protein n=1 Tax=Pseudescherichia vulneris NBRC 102420 TaxID=1115515 RepID=A0A090VAZ7_PSEVU|nr:hypothetical protein [Pseudescherichia vulneris]GAL60534.1 hypothetical protein EV102420_43_00100 [Pseudescherichia vulneris NBRC 102420]